MGRDMIRSCVRMVVLFLLGCSILSTGHLAAQDTPSLRQKTLAALRKATDYYRGHVATHGGYVYFYALDLQRRWGEGAATQDQIWVQPPGTPTVGMAYLAAYRATGDDFYLKAATEAAQALVYGQLESGGWTNSIDFAPDGKLVARYRNGKGRGRNHSTFDDGISPSALQLLMRVDQAHQFQHQEIHNATTVGLNAVLQAQFQNGAFPQVWIGPVAPQPTVPARYPTYDWRTENRIKEYWDLYTLNDDTAAYIANTLISASEIYHDERYSRALQRLGDFLILSQMPDPQPAWAQQYDYQMRPVWARKFEPPAIAGRESEGVIQTLMAIYQHTGDAKYLQPIPRAIAYLKKSRLPDGRLARYYELRSNTPLFMNHLYELTYDDSDVPPHYGWKTESRLEAIEQQYRDLTSQTKLPAAAANPEQLAKRVREIIGELDDQGRWKSQHRGEPLVGQPKFRPAELYLSSRVFSQNVEVLSEYLAIPQ